ncbi:unnamed protein product [Tetraodon nigroviridis]|uniref:(spotted green pufferfish) hypothetical protein n=1 Tax=Tetraodon nigroviridis TaxID=99883 RepID=Q4SL84_TETNG|nr:unnamed protein product [Tetraodon nigroviridis]
MKVGLLLLRVSWFFLWAGRSGCKDVHPAGTGLYQRSKSQAREHARHKHQQPYHRNTSHRRKGEPTTSENHLGGKIHRKSHHRIIFPPPLFCLQGLVLKIFFI